MTANAIGGTAKIYQFPKGGRAGLSGGPQHANPTETFTAPRVTSGGWYHEEAIREAERGRKN
jgi:hypothetical protein